jgi:hypothetical protein
MLHPKTPERFTLLEDVASTFRSEMALPAGRRKREVAIAQSILPAEEAVAGEEPDQPAEGCSVIREQFSGEARFQVWEPEFDLAKVRGVPDGGPFGVEVLLDKVVEGAAGYRGGKILKIMGDSSFCEEIGIFIALNALVGLDIAQVDEDEIAQEVEAAVAAVNSGAPDFGSGQGLESSLTVRVNGDFYNRRVALEERETKRGCVRNRRNLCHED